jgi:hypothetical protein
MTSMLQNVAQRNMARKTKPRPEDRHQVATRVPGRVKKEIGRRASERGLSESAYLRELIYSHLNLFKRDETEPSP